MKEVAEITENYIVSEGPVRLEHIRTLGGANYFSGGPVIHMRVNLNNYNEVYTNQIENFYERLSSTLPTLIEHHCSEGVRGGFFFRVREGTLLGHVIEHVAIELQTLAGMDVSYGKTRSSLVQGVYNIVFRFFDEYAGMLAGKAAVNMINSILADKEFDVLDIIEKLIFIREKQLLGPGTQAIVNELDNRKISWLRLDEFNLIQIGTGKYQKRIRATLTPQTSLLAVENTQDRFLTGKMLSNATLPVPETLNTTSVVEIKQNILLHPGKYIIRPRFRKTSFSRAVAVKDIESLEEKISAFRIGNEELMLQPFTAGHIIRLLVIGDSCSAAVKIELPEITGDGKKTISSLINELNSNPKRTPGDKGSLSLVQSDDETTLILKSLGLDYNSVPEAGKKIILKISPNPNNGSESENISDKVHAEYFSIALKAAHITGLDVAAVNFITPDFTLPPSETGAVLTEIFAAPNLRMYIYPSKGEPQNVVPAFVNHVLGENTMFDIPIISVTGSKGKTTCVKLIFFGLRFAGYEAGMSCSDGLFLEGKYTRKPETIYPFYVHLLLSDPYTTAAVLETPVENIMNYGLGYKSADFGIVLNIGENHLNEIDIKRKDDLAYAKSVVAEEVREDGYSVLNAEDEFSSDIQTRVRSKIAWFSSGKENEFSFKIIQTGAPFLTAGDNNTLLYYNNKILTCSFQIPIYPNLKDENGRILDSVLAGILVLLLMNIDKEHIMNSLDSLFKNN